MDLYWQSDISAFYMLSKFVITFLPRKLISWLQSQSIVILEPKNIKSVTVPFLPYLFCHEVMGPDAVILVFCIFSFKPGKFHRGSLSGASEVVSRKMSSEGLHVKCPRQCLLFTAWVCMWSLFLCWKVDGWTGISG